MKKISETIVFFGSGPVAAKSLELLQAWCNIEAVITKPQPPHHRELFPVIDIAQKYELPLLTASTRHELDELVKQGAFTSRVGVLIDYGIIVSEEVIDSFELGIVNSHFSILPEWRGADPITFAVLSGQRQTGVSLMLLVPRMDEGPLIAYGEYDLGPTITTPELTEDLIELSNALLERTLPPYLTGTINPQAQTVTKRVVSYSRKLTKEDGVLDWQKTAEELEREVRAFAGWPKSRTELAGKSTVITKAHVVKMPCKSGQLIVRGQTLSIGAKHNALGIDSLVPAGKKEMTIAAFLAGYKGKLQQD
jgi:methionyl-tRNA formyltransferase